MVPLPCRGGWTDCWSDGEPRASLPSKALGPAFLRVFGNKGSLSLPERQLGWPAELMFHPTDGKWDARGSRCLASVCLTASVWTVALPALLFSDVPRLTQWPRFWDLPGVMVSLLGNAHSALQIGFATSCYHLTGPFIGMGSKRIALGFAGLRLIEATTSCIFFFVKK